MTDSTHTKLASLETLKEALETTADGIDDQLTRLLVQASAMAERVAGVPHGGLRRCEGIVEYPVPWSSGDACLHLAHRPIESITTLKLAYESAAPSDFDAITSLILDTDYFIQSSELGGLCLLNETWRDEPRSQQVVYTAGFADPDIEQQPGWRLAPEDLQGAVVIQAVKLYNLRSAHGLKGIKAGKASRGIEQADICPELYDAAMRYRRVTV